MQLERNDRNVRYAEYRQTRSQAEGASASADASDTAGDHDTAASLHTRASILAKSLALKGYHETRAAGHLKRKRQLVGRAGGEKQDADDQPRDKDGKFAGKGGSGSTPAVAPAAAAKPLGMRVGTWRPHVPVTKEFMAQVAAKVSHTAFAASATAAMEKTSTSHRAAANAHEYASKSYPHGSPDNLRHVAERAKHQKLSMVIK